MVPRFLEPALRASIRSFPVVLLTGARQVGKSTLAQSLAGSRWPARYLTLDDPGVLGGALRDPDGLLAAHPGPLILDEVHRAPDLLRAVKLRVDRDRKPGRYLLTGSADVLTLPRVSERLAGRVAVHELWPFTWGELARARPPKFLVEWVRGGFGRWLRRHAGASVPDRTAEMRRLVLIGGFPPVHALRSQVDRAAWFHGYRTTYLERDVRQVAAIEQAPEFNRLLEVVAARSSGLLNMSSLSRETGLPLSTLSRYLSLMEVTYFAFRVPPFYTSVPQRAVKTAKLYATDTGLSAHLAGVESWSDLERQGRVGQFVESWVAAQLLALARSLDPRLRLYFWRTHAGREVDFLLGLGERLLAIEVKASHGVDRRDLAGLDACADALGDRVVGRVMAYSGQQVTALDPRTAAIPFSVILGRDPLD